MDSLVKEYLEKFKIKFVEHKHIPVFKVSQSEIFIRKQMGKHTKSLFLEDEKKINYLVTLCAEKRLDIPKLKKSLDIKKLNFAKESTLLDILKVRPGSVSPFCLIHSDNVFFIFDEDILSYPSAGFHPNLNNATLELSKENILKFIDSLPNQKRVIKL